MPLALFIIPPGRPALRLEAASVPDNDKETAERYTMLRGRPSEREPRDHGVPEQTHDVNALSMQWDAKACRVDDFESNFVSGPGHVAQLLQKLICTLHCVAWPSLLRSPKEMQAGVVWPTRR